MFASKILIDSIPIVLVKMRQ